MKMKNVLASAVLSSLVLGAASTTFAAEATNPANAFTDVPMDHWAYDALAQLTADGVITGYSDGTYRGAQPITRYEMAAIIGRAMANEKISAADKAMLDKLSAEFSDELNQLGVRVEKLEKKVKDIRWYGLFRYTSSKMMLKGEDDNQNSENDMRLQLELDAGINENWRGHARVEFVTDTKSAANVQNILGNRIYAEGTYGATVISLGKYPMFSDLDGGMILDDDLSVAQVVFGEKEKIKIWGGRYDGHNMTDGQTVNLGGVELNSNPDQKLQAGLAYYYVDGGNTFKAYADTNGKTYRDDKLNIYEVALGYTFDDNFALSGAYAANTEGHVDSDLRKAYNIELAYKGADVEEPGSYGISVAYRHIGNAAVIAPTYDLDITGYKGMYVTGEYAPVKNILLIAQYFNGEDILTKNDAQGIFGRVEAYF